MPPLKKLINFLDKQKTKYKVIKHKKVYTAFDTAQTQKIDLKTVAKTLLIKGDSQFFFAVIPADKKLDLLKLKKAINKEMDKREEKKIKKIRIASERQIMTKFTKGRGALPPFGSLFKCLTFVDRRLLKNKKINLNAGSFTESLEMTPAQYKKVEKPIEGSFGK